MGEVWSIAWVAALVALAGCGGSSDDRAATPAAPAARPSPLSIDRAEIVAGTTYTTHRFKPALRFTPGAGKWIVANRESSTDFAIAADIPGLAIAELSWHRVTRVFDPAKGGVIPSDLVPFSGDFAKWLTSHPRLRTTTPKEVTVAGLHGVQIDYSSKSQPPRVPRDCGKAGPQCVPVLYDGQDTLTMARGDKGRFIVLDLPEGGQLVIEAFASPAKRFAKMLAVFRSTLESFELAD